MYSVIDTTYLRYDCYNVNRIEYVVTGSQIRMARAALQIGVRELAKLADVAPMTISRIETGQSSGQGDTLTKIRHALEKAGVEFIAENGGGPGVRLRKIKWTSK